jgi:glycerol-3-phosphate O-acyltransferase
MDYLEKLDHYSQEGKLSEKLVKILRRFYLSYLKATALNGYDASVSAPFFHIYLDLILEQLITPYCFEPFHERIREPFDYYQWGIDFIRPLIMLENSRVLGESSINEVVDQLSNGHNVILLANHQTEPDPQIISVLLEKKYPKLVEEMIFVAGHRVVSDPLAVPFSKGRNLLCIYSKKHVETPLEEKQEKLLHNQRTMKKMSQLLSEGGKCIYVAPSGGRDRPDKEGKVNVAQFDPGSLEMFSLMAQQASKQTHFYSLALATYNVLPPPKSVKKELGEVRHPQCTPVHLAFGKEINMDNFPGSDKALDKKEKRKLRASYIWEIVKKDYLQLL